MGPPSLLPPLLPKKTPSLLTRLQRPPSDDGDRLAWFASQLECTIRLSQSEVGDQVRLLPCGHVFHWQEVDEWLRLFMESCVILIRSVWSFPFPLSPLRSPSDLHPITLAYGM